MGRGSNGSSGGGGGSTGLTPNATGGETRVVRGKKINTATVVNQAIAASNKSRLDLDAAEKELMRKGWRPPSQAALDAGFASESGSVTIRNYAIQKSVLSNISRISGASLNNQEGKWNFSNANTIHKDFNEYLWRRVHGHRQRFS